MITLKSLLTFTSITLAVSMANVSFADTTMPTTTTTATSATTTPTTTPVAASKSITKIPKKTTAKKASTSKSGFTCKDGSHSKAKTTRGACSGHGGIAK